MRTILQTSFIKTATVLTMIALAGMATDPVQAAKKRPAKRPVSASIANKPTASDGKSAGGDYVVTVVNSDPVTNHEVNQRAQELAQQLTRQHGKLPSRETLLKQALREIILQKAAIQSVRDTTLDITDEEFSNAEKQLAGERHVPVQEFRKRIMAERHINEAEYRKELIDQLLLGKMRDARTSMATEKVTELDAVHWLRTHPSDAMQITENHVRHILLPASNEAAAQLADVRKRILAGKLDFAAAARKLSQDASASQGGDLGWAPDGAFVPEFQEQISTLKPGDLSQPFASRFGVHLAQLVDRRNSPMTQEQKMIAARNALRQQKAEEALLKWESDVRAQAYIEMREAPR